jgi:hypothetical protein
MASAGIAADAEVRKQLNRMPAGRGMTGSTNRAMIVQYVVARALEGIIG